MSIKLTKMYTIRYIQGPNNCFAQSPALRRRGHGYRSQAAIEFSRSMSSVATKLVSSS